MKCDIPNFCNSAHYDEENIKIRAGNRECMCASNFINFVEFVFTRLAAAELIVAAQQLTQP